MINPNYNKCHYLVNNKDYETYQNTEILSQVNFADEELTLLNEIISGLEKGELRYLNDLYAFFERNNIYPEKAVKDDSVRLQFWYRDEMYLVIYSLKGSNNTTGPDDTTGTDNDEHKYEGVSEEEAKNFVKRIEDAKCDSVFKPIIDELEAKCGCVEISLPREDGAKRVCFYDKAGNAHVAVYKPIRAVIDNKDRFTSISEATMHTANIDIDPVDGGDPVDGNEDSGSDFDLGEVPETSSITNENLRAQIDEIIELLRSGDPGAYDIAIEKLNALKEVGAIRYINDTDAKPPYIMVSHAFGPAIPINYRKVDKLPEWDNIVAKLTSGAEGDYAEGISGLRSLKTSKQIKDFEELKDEHKVKVTFENGTTVIIENCQQNGETPVLTTGFANKSTFINWCMASGADSLQQALLDRGYEAKNLSALGSLVAETIGNDWAQYTRQSVVDYVIEHLRDEITDAVPITGSFENEQAFKNFLHGEGEDTLRGWLEEYGYDYDEDIVQQLEANYDWHTVDDIDLFDAYLYLYDRKKHPENYFSDFSEFEDFVDGALKDNLDEHYYFDPEIAEQLIAWGGDNNQWDISKNEVVSKYKALFDEKHPNSGGGGNAGGGHNPPPPPHDPPNPGSGGGRNPHHPGNDSGLESFRYWWDV